MVLKTKVTHFHHFPLQLLTVTIAIHGEEEVDRRCNVSVLVGGSET